MSNPQAPTPIGTKIGTSSAKLMAITDRVGIVASDAMLEVNQHEGRVTIVVDRLGGSVGLSVGLALDVAGTRELIAHLARAIGV